MKDLLQKYQPTIGIEIHCQLATKSKLFCRCKRESGSQQEPNQHTCEVCLGLPGALPQTNDHAVWQAIRFATAVKSKVNKHSYFMRKQYFYPDLPKGYQITQLSHPVGMGGTVELPSGGSVLLDRVQIEEDAGKIIHKGEDSLVDLNRAGTPLIEIVSAPDMHSIDEALEYVKTIYKLVRFHQISDANMEKGNFRMDLNISLSPVGYSELGVRCEIKNVNSFRFAEKAMNYEMRRQFDILEQKQTVIQQTRGYDPDSDTTFAMRDKEDAHDYRYFDDPDLPVLDCSSQLEKDLDIEVDPLEAQKEFLKLGLNEETASYFCESKPNYHYLKDCEQNLKNKKNLGKLSAFFMTEIKSKQENSEEIGSEKSFEAKKLAEIFDLVDEGVLSSKTAKKAAALSIENNELSILEIAKTNGLIQVQDESKIREVIQDILDKNPKQLEEYRGGKTKLKGFFVGQIMKASSGNFSPSIVQKTLDELLNA